jgi:hypothetical protein
MEQHPIARKDELISEETSGECVIYDSRYKKVHHLNSTLTWIWKACDGRTSMNTMAGAFEQQFDVTDGLGILLRGLRKLDACHLLENQPDVREVSEGAEMTRRGFVARGSLLMPAVISIRAPAAADVISKPTTPKQPKPPRPPRPPKPPKAPKPPKGRTSNNKKGR